MQAKDYRDLFLLAAIWGSSFLFMHLSVADFGPFALVEVRVGFAAIFLLIVAGVRGQLGSLWRNLRHIAPVGVFAAAIPFLLFNYAAQSVPSGMMAVINAMTPLFGALLARIWLGERLTTGRVLGLFLGFTGILILVWGDISFERGGMGWGVAACLGAALCYGFSACYTTRYLKGVEPLAMAAGSIATSALVLLPTAIIAWPTIAIPASAWAAALALSLLCTGLAYIIFYRLIDSVGASRTITVTFLVPIFGILWGIVFLNEPMSVRLAVSTLVVLLGTLLATGFIGAGSRRTE